MPKTTEKENHSHQLRRMKEKLVPVPIIIHKKNSSQFEDYCNTFLWKKIIVFTELKSGFGNFCELS